MFRWCVVFYYFASSFISLLSVIDVMIYLFNDLFISSVYLREIIPPFFFVKAMATT